MKFSDMLANDPQQKGKAPLSDFCTNTLSLVGVNLWKKRVFGSIPYLNIHNVPKCSKLKIISLLEYKNKDKINPMI